MKRAIILGGPNLPRPDVDATVFAVGGDNDPDFASFWAQELDEVWLCYPSPSDVNIDAAVALAAAKARARSFWVFYRTTLP